MPAQLSGKQITALSALLRERTIEDAAERAQVHERTIRRWLKDPFFGEAYRQARRDAVAIATGRLQQVAAEAVTTLQSVMRDDTAPAPARVSAAKTVLELAVKAIEIEDLTARIEVLEATATVPEVAVR